MARPFDSSNYVGQTANPPCSPAQQFVVVVDGAYRGCYGQRTDAENAYNNITGSLGNGATAFDGGSPGNAATATPGAMAGKAASDAAAGASQNFNDFVKQNPWLVVGGAAVIGVLVLRRH